jgi:hypothetical protein
VCCGSAIRVYQTPPSLDLAQNQQTAIRGQTAAVEAGDDLFAGNR